MNRPVLVGDIGGTNARFAVALADAPAPRLEAVEAFRADRYPTLIEAAADYLGRTDIRPRRAILAVAGPVVDGAIELTNSPWRVAEADLRDLGLEGRLINDFEAQAWAAPALGRGDLHHLGGPTEPPTAGTLAVLGPGTGFGVSALARGPAGQVALATEGGHAAFAPGDETELEISRILGRRYGRVSLERLLSGSGLVNIHRALAEMSGRFPATDDPAEITARALAGEDPWRGDLARFCAILGAAAGDIALTLGARGGVYIAGGIAPRILQFLDASPFRERFEAKGRFVDYMRAIPTWVVTHPHAALLGAARRGFAVA